MSKRIADMGTAELLRRVRGRQLDEAEVIRVLRSPYCTVEVAEIVCDTQQWLTSYGVRERLAGFRGLPLSRSMNLLASLPWLSLVQLAREPRTPPVIRRQAEKRLIDRLAKMSLGEKIALARRAHRPLFKSLIEHGDDKVLIALLDNPRLVENDILLILNTTRAPVEFINTVAKHHRWGQYLGVRRALVECASTPVPMALSVLVQLPAADVRRISRHPKVGQRIREAAQALCDRDRGTEREAKPEKGDSDGSRPGPPSNRSDPREG